jgi:hypothetical protein
VDGVGDIVAADSGDSTRSPARFCFFFSPVGDSAAGAEGEIAGLAAALALAEGEIAAAGGCCSSNRSALRSCFLSCFSAFRSSFVSPDRPNAGGDDADPVTVGLTKGVAETLGDAETDGGEVAVGICRGVNLGSGAAVVVARGEGDGATDSVALGLNLGDSRRDGLEVGVLAIVGSAV